MVAWVFDCADSTMHTCCLEQNSNITVNSDNEYLPSETGNLTITYDVTQAYEGNYWALVCVPSFFPLLEPANLYSICTDCEGSKSQQC
jgi:hypothetical protein